MFLKGYFMFMCICETLIQIATACTATIQRSGSSPVPEINGNVILECAVQGCPSDYTLEWRKYTVREDGTNDQLLTVYNYDSSSNGPTETGTNYTIIGRTEYSTVFDVHTLGIKELEIRDNGTWTCHLVSEDYDGNNHDMILIVKAKSPDRPVTIQPDTLNIVNDRPYSFICRVNGVNPAPWVKWYLNDMAAFEGTSDNKIEHLYWSISNTAQITFQAIGEANVKCSMGYNDETWENKSTTVSVRAKASVNDPVADSNDEVKADDIFELTVKASGFRPDLQWQFDDSDIYNGSLYDIITTRDEGSASSTLKSYHLATPFTCDSVTTYEGIYTCKAMLDPEYDSSIISPKMNIKILYVPISSKNDTVAGGLNMDNVVLTCKVCASEPYTEEWSFDGGDLDQDNIENLNNGSIRVKHTVVENFGIYTRKVTNTFGSSICTVALERDMNLDVTGLPPGAIAGIVIAVLAVIIAPILICLFVRYKKKKQQADEEVTAYAESGNTGGANNAVNAANGANTATTPAVYAEVDKHKKKSHINTAAPVYSEVNKDTNKKQNKEEPIGAVYSQVNKPGRPLPNLKSKPGSTNTGPVYSEVNKPKQGRLTPIENQSRGGGSGKYEGVGGRPLPPIKNTRPYDNVGARNDHGGLHYADVDFLRQGNGTKHSHGTTNPAYEPTEYAQIDHRKSTGIVV